MNGSSSDTPDVASADRPGRLPRERLAAFQQRAIAARVPINGSIAMTHRCNLRCVHCYLGVERFAAAPGGERDAAFWRAVVDQVAAAGCLNLLITGGDPLLRADFAEIYARAKRLGLLVTVFTNGTLFDDSHLRLFADLPPVLVEITIYGATREVYERVTGVPGSYQRCLEGIDALRAAGIRVGLKTMILKVNRHEIAAMRAMAQERGTDFRLDPALFPCRDGHVAPLEYRLPPAEAVMLEMADGDYLREAADFFERMRGLPPDDQLFGCMAGLTSFHIDPAGTLLPCMMVTSHGFDLRRGSFLSGWREVLPRFRGQRVSADYQCHRCEKRFLCGLCPAMFTIETGSPYKKSDFLCGLGEERYRFVAEELDRRAREAIIAG
jgi:radical SAM protein with 4Fe4S-binding SPASM domain